MAHFLSRILICAAVATSTALPAAARARIAPSRLASSDSITEMIVTFDDDASLQALARMGDVSRYPGNVAVVSMPSGLMGQAARIKGVSSIRPHRQMRLCNNRAKSLTRAKQVLQGKNLPMAFDGSGVVVGVYDIGMDPNSPNFNDAEGNTRVKAIFQYPEGSADPIVFDTPEEIAGFTTDDTSNLHGTHVMGTLTGSFMDLEDKTDYRGVAPGADIVVATGQGYDSQILDAIRRVGEYARSVGRPAVMNLSWGDNIGPHDGSDPFVRAMDALADEYDMLIVCAAGNEAGSPIAIVKDLTEEDREVKTFLLRGSKSKATEGDGPLQVWTTDETPFTVTLDVMNPANPDSEPLFSFTLPEGRETYLTQGTKIQEYLDITNPDIDFLDQTGFNESYSEAFIGGIVGVNELNNRYCADLYSFLNRTDQNYYIRVRVAGVTGQRIFMYAASADNQYFSSMEVAGHDSATSNGTNSDMASGVNTLSVGSFISDTVYGGTLSAPSSFSSYGPTGDGRFVPDLCAPGQMITSSRSSYYISMTGGNEAVVSYTDPITGKAVEYCLMAGTSMAAPHATGIAALVRQANPELTYQEVKQILIDTANEPTKQTGNPAWGAGRIHAMDAVTMALERKGNSGVSGNLSDSFTMTVYDMQGRRVAAYEGPEAGMPDPTASVTASGVYVVRVQKGPQTSVYKILK